MNYEPQYMTGPVCLNCKSENLESSNYCVFCGDMLKVSCAHCDYKYYKEYLYCPKCGNAKKDIDDGKDSDVSDASLSK